MRPPNQSNDRPDRFAQSDEDVPGKEEYENEIAMNPDRVDKWHNLDPGSMRSITPGEIQIHAALEICEQLPPGPERDAALQRLKDMGPQLREPNVLAQLLKQS